MSVRTADSLPAQEVKAGTGTTMQVLIGSDQGPNFAMRRFTMQPGGGMPYHTNAVEHEQFVLRGSAQVRIGNETHHVKAGDVVYIPAGVPHSYQADEGAEPFEFLCMVPNQDDVITIVEGEGPAC
ncbi:MAG: cupin domain-containing protein [Gemmatimonadota bacterium]|nr:cupin domain-containing protein [Gemmatimonadota bacterium]MDH5759966.1 cupin domain-containing protein [Gemmatimonadota bacterium]